MYYNYYITSNIDINFSLLVMFIFPFLCCWWSTVSALLPAFLEGGGGLLLVLAHRGTLRLRVTQLINGVIDIQVIGDGSCFCVQ